MPILAFLCVCEKLYCMWGTISDAKFDLMGKMLSKIPRTPQNWNFLWRTRDFGPEYPPPIRTSHGGLRNFGLEPPPPATSQDWNFSWRILYHGLVCGDYCCIPAGYRLIAIVSTGLTGTLNQIVQFENEHIHWNGMYWKLTILWIVQEVQLSPFIH